MTDDTPLATLRRFGRESRPWLQWQSAMETRTGLPTWRYEVDFLATGGLADIAYLIAEGWEVHITPDKGNLRVNVYRKKENQ